MGLQNFLTWQCHQFKRLKIVHPTWKAPVRIIKNKSASLELGQAAFKTTGRQRKKKQLWALSKNLKFKKEQAAAVFTLLPTGFGKSLVKHAQCCTVPRNKGGDGHLVSPQAPIRSPELLLTGSAGSNKNLIGLLWTGLQRDLSTRLPTSFIQGLSSPNGFLWDL